ncbi:reverse transcriptase domain-containing protein [Tanacetum coccineum]
MLILVVQHKLFHLNDSDIVDFIVALRMFTRSLVIKRRVEDLQLGVEIGARDKPIKQILAKLEKSGRIAKWANELREHEIKFRGRNSIKGKILADFLVETTLIENKEAKNEEVKRKEPELENARKLFTDGASSSDGSGAGLMVVSIEGKEYTYTLRFEFETTNNEAEYEALLAGLRIAKEMEIREIIIFVDSQLVADQVKWLFEARQPTVKQYLC